MRKVLVVALVALTVASVANAEQITTLYAQNNRGTNGGSVYFDANVLMSGGMTVTGFDTNCYAAPGYSFDAEVYTTPGTYVGNSTNPAVWTMVATGTGTTAGADNPSTINLSNNFDLGEGSWGISIVLTHTDPNETAGHCYTNGPLGPYSNDDVVLTLGAASNTPWGSPFSPRVWNGTMYYVPEPASILLLGVVGLIRRR